MILLESLRIAFGQVWAHKLRSMLTLLGILIGVGSVVGIVSISEGMRRMVIGEFGKIFGDRILQVRPRQWMLRDGRWVLNHRYRPMAMEDVALVKGVSDRIESVLPMLSTGAQMRYAKATWNGQLEATVPAYAQAYDWRAGEGRFLLPGDVSAARSVCVLGMQAKEALFGRAPAVGREVKLNGERYTVAGVMEERTLFGQEWSSIVFVPATTAMRRLFGTRQISGVVAVAASPEEVPGLGPAIVAALQEKYGGRMQYEVGSPGSFLSEIEQTILIMKLVSGGIAGISLLVGGIGIMNMMLVSVTERTREIGIRKAIGAKPSAVLLQFVIEAVVLSLCGGLLGIAAGFGIGEGISAVIGRYSDIPYPSAVSPASIAIALGISSAVGLFFGIYPAARASKLDPVAALGFE